MCGYDLHRHFQYGSYDSHKWCMEPQLYVELMMFSKLMTTSHVSQEMFSKEDVTLCYKHVIYVDVSRVRLIYALCFPEWYVFMLLKLFIRNSYPHVNNTLSIMRDRYMLMSRLPY